MLEPDDPDASMNLSRLEQAKLVSRWLADVPMTAVVVLTLLALGLRPVASAQGDDALAPLVPTTRCSAVPRIARSIWSPF